MLIPHHFPLWRSLPQSSHSVFFLFFRDWRFRTPPPFSICACKVRSDDTSGQGRLSFTTRSPTDDQECHEKLFSRRSDVNLLIEKPHQPLKDVFFFVAHEIPVKTFRSFSPPFPSYTTSVSLLFSSSFCDDPTLSGMHLRFLLLFFCFFWTLQTLTPVSFSVHLGFPPDPSRAIRQKFLLPCRPPVPPLTLMASFLFFLLRPDDHGTWLPSPCSPPPPPRLRFFRGVPLNFQKEPQFPPTSTRTFHLPDTLVTSLSFLISPSHLTEIFTTALGLVLFFCLKFRTSRSDPLDI